MSLTPYNRQILFNAIPELEKCEDQFIQIGIGPAPVPDEVSAQFYSNLALAGSLTNLYSNNFRLVTYYICYLEKSIVRTLSNVTEESLTSILETKLNLLESKYSNVVGPLQNTLSTFSFSQPSPSV